MSKIYERFARKPTLELGLYFSGRLEERSFIELVSAVRCLEIATCAPREREANKVQVRRNPTWEI
ncbi:hypothetical protein NQ315_003937 [Exocentrus adspersus]|uniref:Uncharacterized protein n=1 Tax=Exocentrus adspersus TaxID=1586481 RepID=A0AAV8VY85_9CUCU|nr:hypothetical protein NQ315_003937 [Exocentrus adspersus]